MRRLNVSIILLLGVIAASALCIAAVPQTINYQGYLKDSSGIPVNGRIMIAFALYTTMDPEDIPVWSEPEKRIDIINGIYSTQIGSEENPLHAAFDVPYYLRVTINGEALPLQLLSSVPYAMRAAEADRVTSVTTTMIADGAVTDTKIGGTISADKLDLTTVVKKTGDSMSGLLILPANGLEVGTNQLVASGGRIGIGTAAPNEQLEITGNLRLPATTATTGIIKSSGNTLIHTFGSYNFFSGVKAGNLTMSGSGNVASGYSALSSNTTGSGNTASGELALYSNTTGDSNTAIGSNALYFNTTGNNNTACGLFALTSNTTGSYNTASGTSALSSNTTGTNNSALGYRAGNSNKTGHNNTAIGFEALLINITGSENTASGAQALYSNTTGQRNTASGYSVLHSNTTGSENTAIGFEALYSNTTGQRNTASGYMALPFNTTGYRNTASGYEALYSNTTGQRNTASGNETLHTNTTGTSNTAIGDLALHYNTTGINNTASGAESLYSNTTGSNNTALGMRAGSSSIDGSNNTFIGANAGPATSTQLNNVTAIGYNALVNQSNSLVLGGTGADAVKVGIGTSTPRDHLDIIGTLRMNDNDIYLRGNNGDSGHGLGWYGNGFGRQFKSTSFAEGPVLYGYSAGALGTSADTGNIALKWFSNRNVDVYGNLTKGGGSFKIDHPLDPRNKFLYHSFVESPDMMNIYNGNVTTDASGFAVVEMPIWFEALNREFRYQLTVIGKDSWARARVYEEMVVNRFVIQSDIPDTKVSWQVTGIRKDAYAEKNRILVEEDKPVAEKGSCLHPEACN